MNITTLYAAKDRDMRKALDRYLSQLSKNGETRLWNDEQVLPGEAADAVLRERLREADLVLLLVSQDFWASPTCYEQAQLALRLCRENPAKKLAVVLLRPSTIEDTPFKDHAHLPAQNVCISQYKDPEQGYWDTYQGIKTIIDPRHRYKKRPKIAALRGAALGAAILLLWSLFVLLLPVVYRQEGLRIVPTPFLGEADTVLYYKIYKLDGAAQKDVMLSFSTSPEDTAQYGHLYPYSYLSKTGDANWENNQMATVAPNAQQKIAYNDGTTRYFSQCVLANFNKNDQGEYRYFVEFDKPMDKNELHHFNKKLFCGHGPCSRHEANCENVAYFSWAHYLYFPKARFTATVMAFLCLTLLLTTILIRKKISAHET